MLSVLYSTEAFYTNSPISDYGALLERYSLYREGKLSLWQLLLLKQVNHNHFFVFLLGFLDIELFKGSKILLVSATAISNLMVLTIIIWFLKTSNQLRIVEIATLATFVCVQIYTFLGGEIWLYPFQAVLATFRLFLVLSILLFCLSITKEKLRFRILLLGIMGVTTFLASISHGGGILLLPILLFFSVVLKQKKQVFIMIGLLGLLVIYELNSPSLSLGKLSSVQILQNSFQNFSTLIDKFFYVLGYYSGFGEILDKPLLSKLIGLIGIAFYFLLISLSIQEWVRRRAISSVYLFFSIWSLFSLLGAVMSVMTNIGYAETRNAEMTHSYFLASRYTVTISGFWISIVCWFVFAARDSRVRFLNTGLLAVFKPLLVISSLIVWLNGMLWLSVGKPLYRDFISGEAAAKASVLENLNGDESTRLLGLPAGSYEAVGNLIKTQQTYSIGSFAPEEFEILEKIAKSTEVRVGNVQSVEQLGANAYRVRGVVPAGKSNYIRIASRPVPLVDLGGKVVGVAFLEELPHFYYRSAANGSSANGSSNIKTLSFIGYTKVKNPETLRAIFPKKSLSVFQGGVQLLDQLSQDSALGLKVAQTHIGCGFPFYSSKELTLQAENFSDATWLNGIHRGGIGFFTYDRCKIIHLKIGDTLTFNTSGQRKVVKIVNGMVWLDGSSLDPVGDGYPNKIQVKNSTP